MEQKNDFNDYENLIIPRKTVSSIVAGLILLTIFVFIAGFFWGYRRASYDVNLTITQTGLDDQLEAANLLQEQSGLNFTNQLSENNGNQVLVAELVDGSQVSTVVIEKATETDKVLESQDLLAQDDRHTYYAELIGFGRLKAAQAFVDKMKQNGFELIIQKRVSKNGHGKTINWYQVVTNNFDSQEKLQQFLGLLKKAENLKGIKVKKS